MEKLAAASVHVCGVGALGSNIAVNLARMGVGNLTLIDRDRVEEHNIGTQTYSLDDVGGLKSELLRNDLFRQLGFSAQAVTKNLSSDNVSKILRGAKLVVDVFDNSDARRVVSEYCRASDVACMHAGINDEYGQIRWNETYVVPSDVGLDACDYPMSRNLIMLVSTVACEALIRFICDKTRENYSITLKDLSINNDE